jgi:hypothetical protein
MAMKINSLPTNYKAPSSIYIGSNIISNVNTLIDFKGFAPILIGDGKIPRIWINIPAKQDGSEWYPLVKDNFSTNPSVLVIKSGNRVKVTTPDGVIIDCEKEKNGSVTVNKLNLKPFGLNVYSDEKSMSIMNATFSSSKFSNMMSVIGIS